MNLIWRTLLHYFRPVAAISDVFQVATSQFRVLPTDLDVNGHMNNGRYLSISDIGRLELLKAAGLWKLMRKRGWYPVVASSTISFRKSLKPWQKFNLESRFIGVEGKNVYLEQRFTVAGEVFARMFVAGRFLRDSGGHVPIEELLEFLGVKEHLAKLPNWLPGWSEDVRLPSTRDAAPSVWE